MSAVSEPTVTAQDEVADLLVELIRINTSNPTHAERPAAEWVAYKLDEVGIESRIIEAAPGRASTVARIEGTDSSRPPLLIHGHLDVVPADAGEWSVDPFGGEVKDDQVWGRGAVDMKDMDAMTLAVVRDWARAGRRPPRDIVLAFVSDEEAGGREGAHYLVDHHADLFADCTEAISEVGGFSVSLDEQTRLYLIQTAEKGINWLRLQASGAPGHGSMVHRDNAVTRLAEAVSRIGGYEWPVVITDTVRATVDGLAAVTGKDLNAEDVDSWLPLLGGAARMIGATIRNTTNPTMLAVATRPTSFRRRPRRRSTRASCPGKRSSCSPLSTSYWARESRASSSCATSRSRPASTAHWWTPCRPRCALRTRTATRCRT